MPDWTRPVYVPDQPAETSKTLLVDERGRPILVRVQRSVGFRPPVAQSSTPADRPDEIDLPREIE